MLRVTRLTDYGIVLMGQLAHAEPDCLSRARELAVRAGVPLTTASKILKALCRGGLLVSRRGSDGGYQLARDPAQISVADIVTAIEGPISMTQASEAAGEQTTSLGASWDLVNDAVQRALRRVTLREMAQLPHAGSGPVRKG